MAWVRDRARAVAGTGVTDRLLDVATAAGVAVLVSVGFVTSYATLSSLAVHRGQFPQWLAPAVPLAFDVGIITMSLKVCRLAREGRSAVLLRLLIAALCVCTVVANAAAGVDWVARVLHAVPPAMFVVCFESVVVSVRRHALQRMGLTPAPLPRVRGVRWLLAPWGTWVRWRAMVLADADMPRVDRQRPGEPVGRGSAAVAATLGPPRSSEPADGGAAVRWARSGSAVRSVRVSQTGPLTLPAEGRVEPPDHRFAAAVELLGRLPQLSAPALATELRAGGYALSDRTARRVRARALAQLGRSAARS
jgi:hypothetical protein